MSALCCPGVEYFYRCLSHKYVYHANCGLEPLLFSGSTLKPRVHAPGFLSSQCLPGPGGGTEPFHEPLGPLTISPSQSQVAEKGREVKELRESLAVLAKEKDKLEEVRAGVPLSGGGHFELGMLCFGPQTLWFIIAL